jgi:hypothetical protein
MCFQKGAFGLLAIASISLKRSLMATSKAGLIWEILYSLKAGTPPYGPVHFLSNGLSGFPCALTLNIVDPIIRAVIIFLTKKNLSNKEFDKILIGSTIFENTKQFTMDDPIRCGWCLSSDLYKEYHDQEWGTPVYDDATLFEFLILETFQAGLSWITILNKRRISESV